MVMIHYSSLSNLFWICIVFAITHLIIMATSAEEQLN